MKKLTAVLLALALALTLCVSVCAAGTPAVTHDLNCGGENRVTVKSGEIITVRYCISAPEAVKVSAMQDEILYDHTFFELVADSDAVSSGFADFSHSPREAISGERYVFFNTLCTRDLAAELTEVGTFRLRVTAQSGESTVRSTSVKAYDPNGTLLGAVLNDLTVVIGSGSVTPSAPDAGEVTKDCPRDASCPIAQFTDTANDAWWHDGIHYCVEHGLMNGVGDELFDPNGTTSRAMIVTMLWRMKGRPATRSTMSFKDVPADAWYAEAVRWAQSTGIVKGYDADSFGPGDPITREQLAAILYRYAEYLGVSVSQRADLSGYSDAGKICAWAAENMQWANAEGLVTGRSETTLFPQGMATRAEAATVIARFSVNILG